MADITPVKITSTLTARAFSAAAAGGDKIIPPKSAANLILEFKNTDVTTRTVTITAIVTSKEIAGHGIATIPDIVLALAQNDEAVVSVPLTAFEDPADANKIAVTYDSAVGVSLRALSI